MFFIVIKYLVIIFATLFIIYAMYKIFWYLINMIRLFTKIKKISKTHAVVQFQRNPLKIIFGKKGLPDIIIKADEKNYEVSIISYISTHSRWNIEKTRTRFIFEVRKYENWVYNVYNNSGTEPELSKDYRREISLYRKELFVSPVSDKYSKQIWLVFPKPKALTYCEQNWDYLFSGKEIYGHEIMYLNDFLKLFSQNN